MNAKITIRHVIARLVTGPLYQEETDLWNLLRVEEAHVRAHYAMMGLELAIDEDAGYAYLRQPDENTDENSDEAPMPRLLRRTPLGYHQSILMLLLREKLFQHDQAPDGEIHLYIEVKEIDGILRPYYPETTDEKRIDVGIQRAISRLEELGILRRLPNRSDVIFRVEPILRTKLPVEEIKALRYRLLAATKMETVETDTNAAVASDDIHKATTGDLSAAMTNAEGAGDGE